MIVTEKIASKFFDSKFLEKNNVRNKLFKKLKKNLNIHKDFYKKAKYDASKLIATKKTSIL